MRLSELKELNPKAYEVFLEEIKIFYNQNRLNECVSRNYTLFVSIGWKETRQGFAAWYDVYFKQNFTLFNEWLKNNPK